MINVTRLAKSYGPTHAVRGVSFRVGAGEVYGLLGPNGAGKSTTIGVISGLLRPTSGSVTVDGHDVVASPIAAKRALGVVPQQSIVVEELSALQNCLFFGSLYDVEGGRLRERSLELLKWIGLADRANESVSNYSGGMLRRLTLILAMLHEPKALVLDEPTVGLDPQTRRRLHGAIQEVASRGTAVLLSTHYLDEAEQLCGRIGIIDHGEIVREGTLAELRESIEDAMLFSVRGDFDRAPLLELVDTVPGAAVLRSTDEDVLISIPSHSDQTARLLETASSLDNIREVTVKPPSLESLFINLTGHEIRD